jgi:hypothetical protein
MPILIVDDFRNKEVKKKLANEADYIADELVQVYWNALAKWVNCHIDNLPAVPSRKVKEYLMYVVMIDVASNNIGTDLKRLTEDITVDQWEARLDQWSSTLNAMKSDISFDDVVDPNNLPDVEDSSNTMISEWVRG